MRLETRLTFCVTLVALAVLAVTPVGSQESKGKITLTMNPDGSMNIEANLRVPSPAEITSVEADGAIDYNPSAGESVIHGTIDIALAPSILAALPIRNVNVSFSGTETTTSGTLGLELSPSEQIPVQGIWANLNSQTDAAGNVTTINVDGYYTVAYVRPWSKENITAFIVLLQSQLKSSIQEVASITNNTVQVTKLEFSSQPELFDTYAKSTFSATVLIVSSQLTSVPAIPGEMLIDPEALSKIMAELQRQDLARIRTWQAEGTYSNISSKIEASYNLYLTGDIDTSINAMINVYRQLVESGAIKGFDTRLTPLLETKVSLKGSSFKVTTSQGELQITAAGIVLKPPIERTPTGFRISPEYIAAASTQLNETSQGLEITVKGNGVDIKVSPEAPTPTTATSSQVVWPDFNVNLLSYLEFTGPAVTTTTTTPTISTSTATSTTAGPSGPDPWLTIVVIAVVVIVIIAATAVLLLRRKKQTTLSPRPSATPIQ